jgi:hypothetical protein
MVNTSEEIDHAYADHHATQLSSALDGNHRSHGTRWHKPLDLARRRVE